MLTHNKVRLMLSLCGIAFATLVLFMGIGFFNGLNDSQANLATVLNADLVMIHKKTRSMNSFKKINRTWLYQALAQEDVIDVIPVYDGQTKIINPQSQMSKTIYFFAFPVDKNPFNIPGFDGLRPGLRKMGTIVFDAKSRQIYGRITPGMTVDIAGIPHTVSGTVDLGPNFVKNGYIIMGDHTLIAGLKKTTPDRVSFGLISIRPGADIDSVKQQIHQGVSDDYILMTPSELRQFEINFTITSTPVGALLGIGLIVGFIIGVIISYQILYNEVIDHMPQFATMKAVGFSRAFLISIVLKEAFLLSVLGFIPGLAASLGLYAFIEYFTRIIMVLNVYRVAWVFALTVFMCVIAGMLAVKKVLQADPAELF